MQKEQANKTLSIFPGTGMGDGLLTIMLAHNAVRNGYRVEVYSKILRQLDHWFPEFRIQDVPDKKQISHIIESQEKVFIDSQFLPENLSPTLLSRCVVASKREFDRKKHYIDNLKNLFVNQMALHWYEDSNGIVAPTKYQRCKHAKRVCLHVTSANAKRNWPVEKFLKLAKLLQDAGYQPAFVLASHEFEERRALAEHPFTIEVCADLDELAGCLYESAAMIANDSGPGHLAACLGLSVVTIFCRGDKYRHWRPLAKHFKGVLPCFRLPGKAGHRYWKNFISVPRVMKAFLSL